MRAKLTKEEMMERIKFYEENGEAAFITKYNRYRDVIYVYRKKLGLSQSRKTKRKYKLPKLYSNFTFVNFTKEDKIKFIEYYKTHTGEDAGKHYGISAGYVAHCARVFSLEIYAKQFYKDKNKGKSKLTKEDMVERIKFYEENGEAALKNKYKIGKASILRYQTKINRNRTNTYRSPAEKRELIEYYKTHTGKETAIKYGFSSASSAGSLINFFASELGYPKPLKYNTHKLITDKEEMLERIKFYEENGIEKYADRYGYNSESSAHVSIIRHCKYLKRM